MNVKSIENIKLENLKIDKVNTLSSDGIYLLPIIDDVIKEIENKGINDAVIFYGKKTDAWKICGLRPIGFLEEPINELALIDMINGNRTSVLIRNGDGLNIIPIFQINYVNLENRSLMFHLSTGEEIRSFTIQKSFEKMIGGLKNNKRMIFVPPTLSININNIKILRNDNIEFKNNDIGYFPIRKYPILEESLKKCCNFEKILI